MGITVQHILLGNPQMISMEIKVKFLREHLRENIFLNHKPFAVQILESIVQLNQSEYDIGILIFFLENINEDVFHFSFY